MRIQVKTLTGKTANIELTNETSICELSNMIQNDMSVPVEEQKLLFNGQILSEGTVADYGLIEESAIHMVIAIDGGKGKKKKKKIKKPKRQHKKKKVKLAILGYYKVEDGKVKRLRQRSPTGTFMAEHSDRFYCGRSHIIYKRNVTEPKKVDAKAAKTDAPVKAEKGKKGKK